MNSENLLYTIGKINNNIIQEATPTTKNGRANNWAKFAAIAACLALVLTVTIFINSSKNLTTGDIKPMVYVNGILYGITADNTSFDEQKEDFIYLGKINSIIASSDTPHQEFQANDNIIGSKVYQYNENIVVLINNKHFLYEISHP